MVPNKGVPVHAGNYRRVHRWIDERLGRYQINVEQWVVARFWEIPAQPSVLATESLDRWIKTYLPDRVVRDMWKTLGNQRKQRIKRL